MSGQRPWSHTNFLSRIETIARTPTAVFEAQNAERRMKEAAVEAARQRAIDMAAEEAIMIAEAARRKAQSERNAAAYRAKVDAEAKAVANARANQSRRNRERAAESAAAGAKSLEIAFANIKTREQLLKNAMEEARLEMHSPEGLDRYVTNEIRTTIELNTKKIETLVSEIKRNGKIYYATLPAAFVDVILNIFHVKSFLIQLKNEIKGLDTPKCIGWFQPLKVAMERQINLLIIRLKIDKPTFDELMKVPIMTGAGVKPQPLLFYYTISIQDPIFTEEESDKIKNITKHLRIIGDKIDEELKSGKGTLRRGGRRTFKRMPRRKNSRSRHSRA